MNKKGETQTGYLVPLIVALAVLALVIVGIWAVSSGKISFWKDIPVPGQKNDTIKIESATFRYIVSDDAVEYYTGTEWKEFKGKNLDIGNKRVSYDELSRKFYDYFYASRGPERVRINEDAQKILYDGYKAVPVLDAVFVGVLKGVGTKGYYYVNGNVYIELKKADVPDDKVYGQIISNPQGEVYLNRVNKNLELPPDNYVKQDTSLLFYKGIATKAEEYRDRVLKKPVELSWGIVEKGKEVKRESGKFCTEKIIFQGKMSLVVRLEKPERGETC
jgi:hypothetical protein